MNMKPYTLEKTVDGDWMVLIDGVQWGRGPRDKSGASSQTWPTRREAREAVELDAAFDHLFDPGEFSAKI